eukprot:scaffold42125_cov31-Tisochrysis_lutea.AAC.2
MFGSEASALTKVYGQVRCGLSCDGSRASGEYGKLWAFDGSRRARPVIDGTRPLRDLCGTMSFRLNLFHRTPYFATTFSGPGLELPEQL